MGNDINYSGNVSPLLHFWLHRNLFSYVCARLKPISKLKKRLHLNGAFLLKNISLHTTSIAHISKGILLVSNFHSRNVTNEWEENTIEFTVNGSYYTFAGQSIQSRSRFLVLLTVGRLIDVTHIETDDRITRRSF